MLTKPRGKERIIVAVDVSNPDQAYKLVMSLRDHVGLFKFGFEFMQSINSTVLSHDLEFDDVIEQMRLYRELFFATRGRVFWDGKFHDISNTVAAACRNAAALHIQMLNVHCSGGRKMMSAAVAAVHDAFRTKGDIPLVLGVTLLTSLGYDDLVELGFASALDIANAEELKQRRTERINEIGIHHLAQLAQDSGLDGIVCSPEEVSEVRRVCGPDFVAVTPGVRPAGSAKGDQERVKTPGEAVEAGSTFLVIGRPVTEANDPVEAAKQIALEILVAEERMATS